MTSLEAIELAEKLCHHMVDAITYRRQYTGYVLQARILSEYADLDYEKFKIKVEEILESERVGSWIDDGSRAGGK